MAKETIGTEITKKAFEYIDAIASNLGVATEYVFTILVRQQFAEGISGVLIMLALVTVGSIIMVKIHKKDKKYWDSDVVVLLWIATIVFALAIIGAAFALQNDIMKIVNPEYYAIKEILDAITGGKSE